MFWNTNAKSKAEDVLPSLLVDSRIKHEINRFLEIHYLMTDEVLTDTDEFEECVLGVLLTTDSIVHDQSREPHRLFLEPNYRPSDAEVALVETLFRKSGRCSTMLSGEDMIWLLETVGSMKKIRMTPQLKAFALAVHALLPTDRYPHLHSMGTDMFATMAIGRWRKLKVAVDCSESADGEYFDLAEDLKVLAESTQMVEACLLTMPMMTRCAETGVWSRQKRPSLRRQ